MKLKTPVEYFVDNVVGFGKSNFGGILLNDGNISNNKDIMELMVLTNFTIICVIILLLAYLVYSFIAINKVFVSNSEIINKYKTIAYISLLISGWGTGWIFILLWVMGITY